MPGVADDRGELTLALVGALRAELADALRAVAWYGDGDRGLVYVHPEVDAPDGLVRAALRRRPDASRAGKCGTGAFEYAIDAYEEVLVVTLTSRALVPPAGGVAGVALAVERDAPLADLTAAIERAVATYRRTR